VNKLFLKKLYWKFFRLMQYFKIDVLPRHFYSEIPCIGNLEKDNWWRKPYDFEKLGITEIKDQILNFRKIFNGIHSFVTKEIYQSAVKDNGCYGYGQIEACILYFFVKSYLPRKIVQIGCGVSTSVLEMALKNVDKEIICIEPYPNSYLESLEVEGKITLVRAKVQEFDDIKSVISDCDFLFIDSTHALGPAGEVSRIILDYIPVLKSGSMIHFHDIYFPYDYQSQILESNLFFQHESVLLQAFLSFNSKFKLMFSSSMIFHSDLDVFKSTFFDFEPRILQDGLQIAKGHFPTSCFIQKL